VREAQQLWLGIGIKADAASIDILVSDILVRSIPVPDWVPFFQYWTGSSICISFNVAQSGIVQTLYE
jgi:hypothetical protein